MTSLPVISTCSGCRGACCRNNWVPPFASVSEARAKGLSEREVEDLLIIPRSDNPCLWLDSDGRCSHYDQRPQACRDFELGGLTCLRNRHKYGVQVLSQSRFRELTRRYHEQGFTFIDDLPPDERLAAEYEAARQYLATHPEALHA